MPHELFRRASTTGRRPIGFFVHHHGRGHAKRCAAIIDQLSDRPVTVFCGNPELLDFGARNVNVIALPNTHGAECATRAMHDLPPSSGLDCAPVGVPAIRASMGRMARWMAETDPALMVVDVSAEVAMLARICSVPAVKIRMHGDRNDAAHRSAYTACAGLLAPFDERLEQPDWPADLRARTFYCGGLVDDTLVPASRADARRELGLDAARPTIVVMSGAGGAGISLASVSMAARAMPETHFILAGKIQRLGHETDFANVTVAGWVDTPLTLIAAADVVVAAPGDTLVHEIARVGRPLACVPEWCYYNEQDCKARALQAVDAAAYAPTWPSSFDAWRALVERARGVDVAVQRSLVDGAAAARAANYLETLADQLWLDANEPEQERVA